MSSTAGTETFVRGSARTGPQRRRWLGPALTALMLVLVGLLTLQPPDSGVSFDPESTGPVGLRAVVDTLRELDVAVTLSEDLDAAAGADSVLVPPLGWTAEAVDELARRGPRVVAQVPPSPDAVSNPLGVGGIGLVDLAPECDLLADVDTLRTSQWPGWQPDAGDEVAERCITRDSAAWLHRLEVGDGELVSLSTMAPLTNERFRDSDAALAAVRLLAPTGTETVVVLRSPPGERSATLLDVIDRRWLDAAWLTLLVLVVLALAQGRRLGRPTDEQLPVRVPSGELARAIGDLRQRAGHHERSAAVLRARTLEFCRRRLGLPPDASADAVLDDLQQHGLATSPGVAAALTGPLPSDADGLVATSRALAELRGTLRATSLGTRPERNDP